MKRVIALIILLVIIIWLAIFIAVNLHKVEVYWFFGKTWGSVPLIGVILGSLLLGTVLVALAGGASQARLRSQNRSQRRTIKRLERELSELRSLSLKEMEQAEDIEEDVPEGRE